ncbi:hypothetical protein LIX60_29775 [Streptomyces sp. S07_1.15]|uniref:hypothetical protein n=1 Tax=Streptomyces sp. S07_1.15 TaxID=2873925 RepID=UPI001D15AD09|nr:hypothetical protein [Streptomyces sp. S07_1.15]MCC3655576.1 hypothetical protein [Streptomyces sp. S07_1.15]
MTRTGTGTLLAELHEAEEALAREFHRVAERQAADHGTHYPCLTLAAQCEEHAARLRTAAGRHGRDLSEPRHSEPLSHLLDAVRRKSSERRGHHTSAGQLLLRDLRHLLLAAQEVSLLWLLLGQVARAVRDQELLDDAEELHPETLGQIGWLTTRLKNTAPQVLATAD